MKFELLPVVDVMTEFYKKPLNHTRFQEYLHILHGDTKGILKCPVSSFNPMAKEHLLVKLEELNALHAEEMIRESLNTINAAMANDAPDITYRLALNVADDLQGGWTNHYTTDYDSKFKFQALIRRQFCVPLFWSSEQYEEALIRQRTLEYVYRTYYWQFHPRPSTLAAHIRQEQYVAIKTGIRKRNPDFDFEAADVLFKEFADTDSYPVIFNFLFGDDASAELAYPQYGMKDALGGFKYAASLNRQSVPVS